ncbi:MAG: polysaccharide deacetylase [Lachnospiraceae bacterium]|nr:polysaccharide deacetylase [Lachnospiraceae bacterium]
MRVHRLKQLILLGPYIVFLITLVFCIVLFVMINKEDKRLDAVEEEIGHVTTNQDSLIEQFSSVTSSVDEMSSAVAAISNELSLIDIGAIEQKTGTDTKSGSSPRYSWPKKVYLTFDDGPSANTEKILDILDKYGVKGNFFVVGTENPELRKMYKRILDKGHVLCMHSYSHKYNEIYSSVDAFTADLDKISELLYDETGQKPLIYRFPGGSSNSVSRIPMSEFIKVLDDRGIDYYDWNVVAGDATNPMLPADKIIENSLCDLNEYEEAMILFHDLSNKTSTVEALPEIIEAIQKSGIPIVPIDDTTMTIKHYTNND